MKNVSIYYHDKVPIWNGGVGGEGVGAYLEQLLAALMMLLKLWVGGMNKMISYGDDDDLFSVFCFQVRHFALKKAHCCCFLNPAVACNINIILQG